MCFLKYPRSGGEFVIFLKLITPQRPSFSELDERLVLHGTLSGSGGLQRVLKT